MLVNAGSDMRQPDDASVVHDRTGMLYSDSCVFCWILCVIDSGITVASDDDQACTDELVSGLKNFWAPMPDGSVVDLPWLQL